MKNAAEVRRVAFADGSRPSADGPGGDGRGGPPTHVAQITVATGFPLREFAGILTSSLIGGTLWLLVLTLALAG